MASRPSSEAVVTAVETSLGPARFTAYAAAKEAATEAATEATVVLGHGAGRGCDTHDLLELARALPAHGITVVLVDQPWVLAGKRVASPPASLDRAWLEVVRSLPAFGLTSPLVVGGRSAGARVACRTAGALGAIGVLALAFPLHPPGRPERTRVGELLGVGVPTLVVQGDRDTFGGPDELPSRSSVLGVLGVSGADHSLRRGRTPVALPVDAVAVWVLGLR